MAIFGNFIFLQIVTGFDPDGGRRNTIVRMVYVLLFGLFYLTTLKYIAMHVRQDNINQALYVVPIMNAYTAFVLTYIYVFINRKQFYALLDDMEKIVHKSV